MDIEQLFRLNNHLKITCKFDISISIVSQAATYKSALGKRTRELGWILNVGGAVP